MPKKAVCLNALAVSRLVEPGFHRVGTVPGLALQIAPTGARTWVLRYAVGGKRHDMGLGGYPAVTLAGAWEAARKARQQLQDGSDPIQQRRESFSAMKAAAASAMTFEQAARSYVGTIEKGWKNAKHAAQWTSTLETYAYPVIGKILVRDVELPHVLRVLQPIWSEKTETAVRLRGRIERVLDWATVSGYRVGLNPARWSGHMDKVLPKPSDIAEKDHHEAIPVSEIGAFVVRLRDQAGTAARALEFAILTAARSGEVRGAKWSEIDMAAKLWTVPAERMKAKKEHQVPLSDDAIKILNALPRIDASEFVFTAPRGGIFSDMALTAVMRRMNETAVPHGFRSTFRDWASEQTNYPREAAEMALAHTISDKVEAAYRRGNLLAKRVRMMADWARFCAKVQSKGAVIPMNQAA